MANVDNGQCECAVCGERASFNELWMDWVCGMCADGSWREEIKRRVASFKEGVTISMIIRKVSEKTGITHAEMCMKTRKRAIVEARQMLMWLLRHYTKLSFSQIGAYFAQNGHVFDHSTTIYACKAIDNLIFSDKKFKSIIKLIKSEIGSSEIKYK
jgi:chromosomal replication initiation ATPase DnaA